MNTHTQPSPRGGAQLNILDGLSLGKIVQIRERLMRAQAAGRRVFRLESGDPSFSLAPHVLLALQTAAAEGKTHYVPNAGIPELRRTLWEKLERKNGIRLGSSENVFVTNGAMHALHVTFQSLLSDGDEVIVPDPMWTEVVENIKLARGIPVGVPLEASAGFQYVPREIERRLTTRTRAIFLNTPHNPTGAVLSRDTLLEIGRIARERELLIVSDEAYEDVIYPPETHLSIASLLPDYSDHIVSIFSFSKSYAMSGLRVGYLATSDEVLMDRLQKALRCTINGVNSVAQWAALAALSGEQQLDEMRAEYALRRALLLEAIGSIPGLRPFRPKGGFFIWARIEPSLYERVGVRDADGLSAFLAERGVGSAPGDAFGEHGRDAIRFAFSCETKMVREGAAELVRLLG